MEDPVQIDKYILVGALMLSSLSLLLIAVFFRSGKRIKEKENQMQLEIFRGAAEAEERQKQEIAKNLHDGIIPTLSAVQRSLDKNANDYGSDQLDIRRFKTDVELIGRSIENIRRISHALAPKELAELGLIKSLKDFVVHTGGSSDKETVFENLSQYDFDFPFSNLDQLNIYLAYQEIINNLVKYSNFNFLKVSLEQSQGFIEIVFMHNGKGMTNEQVEGFLRTSVGLGLISLKKRCLILNATINYTIESEFAYTVFSIPFKK